MRFGVLVFPGSSCEQDVVYALRYLGQKADYVWHQDRDLSGFDAVVLPSGFSYGNYLRCGAIASFSPIMEAVIAFANEGGPVIGIGNGFQILTEAHLLPGVLLRNSGLKYICKSVPLRVEQNVCKWLDLDPGVVVHLPISHSAGNFICNDETLATLRRKGQIVLRYCAPDGSRAMGGSAPNGALDDIAGICNEQGNVFGLMPHPERATDGLFGEHATNGVAFFEAIITYTREANGS